MSIFEDESLVMDLPIAQYASDAMRVSGPIRNGNRVVYRFFAVVARCRVLSDYVIGDHASRVADVEHPRKWLLSGNSSRQYPKRDHSALNSACPNVSHESH